MRHLGLEAPSRDRSTRPRQRPPLGSRPHLVAALHAPSWARGPVSGPLHTPRPTPTLRLKAPSRGRSPCPILGSRPHLVAAPHAPDNAHLSAQGPVSRPLSMPHLGLKAPSRGRSTRPGHRPPLGSRPHLVAALHAPSWAQGPVSGLQSMRHLGLEAPSRGRSTRPGQLTKDSEVHPVHPQPHPHLPHQNICAIIPTAARAAPACTFPIE